MSRVAMVQLRNEKNNYTVDLCRGIIVLQEKSQEQAATALRPGKNKQQEKV